MERDVDIPLTFGLDKLSQMLRFGWWFTFVWASGSGKYYVFSAVAESTWTGHDGGGFLWRSSALTHNGADWPDVINADVETADHERDDLGTASGKLR